MNSFASCLRSEKNCLKGIYVSSSLSSTHYAS